MQEEVDTSMYDAGAGTSLDYFDISITNLSLCLFLFS